MVGIPVYVTFVIVLLMANKYSFTESLTNFIIQQSRSSESICIPLCLMNRLFPRTRLNLRRPSFTIRHCTDLEQSSAAYHICSVTSY